MANHHSVHNRSSANSTKSEYFKLGAVSTYGAVLPCLMNSPFASENLSLLVPPSDLKEHYLDMMEKTRIFRGVPVHSYHFAGPWIGRDV